MEKQYFDYELEDGTMKQIPMKSLERMMNSARLNVYEAAYLYACDMGWEVDEEQEELVEETKDVKVKLDAKTDKPKEKKARKKRVCADATKTAVVEFLASLFEGAVVVNKTKLVYFVEDGYTFKLDLIRTKKMPEVKTSSAMPSKNGAKVDAVKCAIVEKVAAALNEKGYENVVVVNKAKMVVFNDNEGMFKLDLVKTNKGIPEVQE